VEIKTRQDWPLNDLDVIDPTVARIAESIIFTAFCIAFSFVTHTQFTDHGKS
jgi:hypothetical protein